VSAATEVAAVRARESAHASPAQRHPHDSRREAPVRIDAALRAATALAACAFVVLFVAVALARLRYPYELEWMEGGVLDSVRRAASGRSLYVRPSLQFTPYLYTPLYYYVGAAAGAVFGTTVATLRLVSFVSAIAATLIIGALVRHETRDMWAAVVSAGVFLACYRISGAWLDVARVDTLFLALTLAGVLLARTGRRAGPLVLAGVVTGLAVETKQQALLVGIAVFFALVPTGRRRAMSFLVGLVGTVAVISAVLELTSGGWFHVYAVDLLLHHHIIEPELVQFWTRDLWVPLAVAITIGVALFAMPRALGRDARRFYGFVTISLIAVAYSSRLHSGGYDNVLLPAYAAVAVVVGLAVHHLGRPGPLVPVLAARVVLVAVLVQFGVLVYDPGAQIPRDAAVRHGDALLAELRELPGPIALFGHGWYAERAGHVEVVQCAALEDVLRAHIAGVSDKLDATRERAFANHVYRAVVVDTVRSLSCVPTDMARYYRPAYRLRAPDPLTGTNTRPATVWLPRS
jgi:hypothetical protein